MTQFIETIFSSIFGEHIILATLLIAMIPIIELKGAIPFSMSAEIWGANALGLWPAFFWSLLGSSLIVPVLALIYIPLINWLKKTRFFKKIATRVEDRINSRKENIETKVQQTDESTGIKSKPKKHNKAFFMKVLWVFVFAALPLPFTGVWTGTCLAVALGLGFGWSCLTVISGNAVAGLMITGITAVFPDSSLTIFYIFLGIALLPGVFLVAKNLMKNKKKNVK